MPPPVIVTATATVTVTVTTSITEMLILYELILINNYQSFYLHSFTSSILPHPTIPKVIY